MKFSKMIDIEGISYPSLLVHLTNTVQFGGDKAELWTVLEDNEPKAFAHWFVCGLPHVGKVFCDFLYSWGKQKNAAELLLDEFAEFGKRSRASLYMGEAITEQTFRLFRKAAARRGYEVKRQEKLISFSVKKKGG